MKKHKLEFSIGAIFVAFVVLLMWQNLSVLFKALPITLISLCLVLIVYLLSPLGENKKNDPQNNERYAPKYFAQAILSSLIGVAIIVFGAVILNKDNFSKTFDLTTNKINSLSEESYKFLESLSVPVQIVCVPSQNPTENYCDGNQDLINLFAKRSKFIVNAGALSLVDRETIAKLQPSGYSRLILMSDTNKSELDGVVSESRLTNAIINLVKFKKVVYFLSGSGEPSINADSSSDRNYSEIINFLHTKAYDAKEWNIKQGLLPADARVLVAGDNNIPYNEETQNIIQNFIAHGGRLILIVNPYREQGLDKLYSLMNLKLDPILLTLNLNTALGKQMQNQNPSRPPVPVSNFNKESPITRVIAQSFGSQVVMPIDGGRPISILSSDKSAINTTATVLFSSFSAAPITLSPETRNKIDLNVPFNLSPDRDFDANKSWPLSVNVEINNASKFALDKSPVNVTDATKDKSEVIVFGFSLISLPTVISQQLIPLSVAHLYQDQELVTIPPRDFTPKQFNLSRNPGAWLLFFAGILPLATAIMGLFIWSKRRSA
ncbi:Gldg family protein [Silvanigrella aquatica]|uniref:ABC-type uncharacterized transport system domain-containing protein n=1 Tax=Silvanigrella aquatica TaxID=1915309 RepID=A0A1L4D391_9BACT|nr:Gldg family protein [Silvanigrella aquatica]APJ04657.1 hypothetical protein AXG55_12385 [Silvanigrella aquatica]